MNTALLQHSEFCATEMVEAARKRENNMPNRGRNGVAIGRNPSKHHPRLVVVLPESKMNCTDTEEEAPQGTSHTDILTCGGRLVPKHVNKLFNDEGRPCATRNLGALSAAPV